VSFSVAPGRIVGLIGPNGAGKTPRSRRFSDLPVSARACRARIDPRTQRDALMREVASWRIVVLPRWLRSARRWSVAGVHPRFDRARATEFLSKTTFAPAAVCASSPRAW